MPRVNVKDRRRQQLIDANIASIAKRGLAETTITHVSEGACMSRGIVNFYFETKEAMMLETLHCLLADYAACWQGALKEGEPAQAQLRALIDANFDGKTCGGKRLAAWSAFWGHAASHKEYARLLHTGDEAHIACITQLWERLGKHEGAFPMQLHAMIRGMWLMLLVSPGIYEAKALAQDCQRALREAMAQPEAKEEKKAEKKPARKEEKVVSLLAAKKNAPAKKKPALPASKHQLDFADLFGG